MKTKHYENLSIIFIFCIIIFATIAGLLTYFTVGYVPVIVEANPLMKALMDMVGMELTMLIRQISLALLVLFFVGIVQHYRKLETEQHKNAKLMAAFLFVGTLLTLYDLKVNLDMMFLIFRAIAGLPYAV